MKRNEILEDVAMKVPVDQIKAMRGGTGGAIKVGLRNGLAAIIKTPRGFAVDQLVGEVVHFLMTELEEEVKRLLNNPAWDADSEGATHKAMDSNGDYFFYDAEPNCGKETWQFREVGGYGWLAGSAIAIPAGYDWKQSLEARPV